MRFCSSNYFPSGDLGKANDEPPVRGNVSRSAISLMQGNPGPIMQPSPNDAVFSETTPRVEGVTGDTQRAESSNSIPNNADQGPRNFERDCWPENWTGTSAASPPPVVNVVETLGCTRALPGTARAWQSTNTPFQALPKAQSQSQKSLLVARPGKHNSNIGNKILIVQAAK